MASVSWKKSGSGVWSAGANWSTGSVPGAADDVTIAVAGTYTVSLNTAQAAHSLTLNDSGANVADSAVFTLGGLLAVTAGTFTLGGNGVVQGGTVAVAAGGTLLASGGTLSGVTYQGTLDLSKASSNLSIAGGTTFTGAGGSGTGTIDFTGNGAQLFVDDNTTLDNATLNFGGANVADYIYLYPVVKNNDTLTFGSHLNVVASASGSYDRINLYNYPATAGLINQGTITASAHNGTFQVYGGSDPGFSFSNSGLIAVSNGDSLDLSTVGVFTNSGTLTATGSLTTVSLGNAWSNTGVISAASNATINLGGTFTTAGANSITNSGGTVNLTGLLNNTGTLTVNGPLTLANGGTISGGTVIDASGSLIAATGTLINVHYDGTLNIGAGQVYIEGNDTFAGANGTGNGVINLTGSGGYLFARDNTTLDNATLNIGNNNGYDRLYFSDDTGTSQTLTLGSHLAINQTGTYAQIDYDTSGDGLALVNDGTITAGAKNGILYVYGNSVGDTFTNAGTLAATNSGTLDLSTNITTSGLGVFSTSAGGVIRLDNGSTLSNAGATLNLGTASQLTLAGTVNGGTISDAGSGLIGQGGTLNAVTYLGTLALTAAGASLNVTGGLNVSTGGSTGTINVTGSNASLNFYDTQTLDNANVSLGNNSGYSYLRFYSDKVATQTLTLGSHLAITQSGTHAYLQYDASGTGDALVNDGTITAGVKNGVFYIYGPYVGDSFTNAGTLIASNSGEIELQTNVTTAGLGTFSTSGGGEVLLDNSYTLANTGATLNLSTASQLTLAGTINGGTISDAGSGLIGQGGTLNAVTYLGTLSLATNGADLSVTGGLNVSTGGSSGVINLTGSNAELDFYDTQTLDNATINLGNNSYYSFLRFYSDKSVTQTLTLGNHLSINQAGTYAYLEIDNQNTGNALVNDGTIGAGVKNGILYIYGSSAGDSFTNAGTLIASNSGTIDLQTNITTAGLGTFSTSGGGEVLFDSSYTLANTGATLNLSMGSQLTLAGTINGGTITDAGTGLIGQNGTLNAVTYLGTLTLTAVNASLNITGGLNVSMGGSAGAISLTGSGATLNFYDTQTLDNANVSLGSNGSLRFYSDKVATQTLTLGSHLAITQAGASDVIYYDNSDTGNVLVNDGTITAGLKNGVLSLYGPFAGDTFTNVGTLIASNSGTLDLETNVTTAGLGTFSTSGGGEVLLDSGYTLANTGATLNLSTASQLTLAGTINGGTINDAGNGLIGQGGTLNAVTYLGTLTLGTSQSLNVTGGLNVSTGGSTGAINLTGSNATLNFYDTQTLDNANVSLATNSSVRFYSDKASTQTLTLGSHLATTLAGTSAIIYIDLSNTGNALVNDGTITAGTKNGQLIVAGSYAGDTFTNAGTLIATNSGTLDLQTNVTTAGLGNFSTTGGGEVLLDGNGTLTNTGATLNLSTGSQLTLAGTINGGTISDAGTGLIGQGGTLNAVTYLGTLALTTSSASLDVTGGLNVSTGGQTGVIDVTGSSANLQFTNTQTIDNAIVNLGTNGGTDSVFFNSTKSATQTLTLGNHLSISQVGANAQVYYDNSNSANVLINGGTITAGLSGKNLSINGPYAKDSFTNTGSLVATAGGTLTMAGAGTFTNLVAGTLTGGSYESDAGSVLELANNATVTTDAATIILSGTGSTLQAYSTGTAKQVTLDQKLTTIAAAGTLELLAGRSFAASAAFTDSGFLQLGGGTFTAASGLTLAATGSLAGNGTVAAAVANAGKIEAKGGNLLLSGAITGSGALQVDANATLEIGGSVPASQTASFSGQGGTLKLDAPLSFAAPIAGLAAGDVIDLAGLTATSAVANGTTLAVSLSGGSTLNLALAAPVAGERFGVVGDGHGGSDVIGYRYAAGTLAPTTIIFGNVHVGDTDRGTVALTNTAAADGYSEALDANFSAMSAGVTTSGSVNALAPQATNSGALAVGIATSAAGTFAGTATLALSTDGAGTDGGAALSIGTQTVAVSGAAYAYAAGTLATTSLAFGNHHVGDAATLALALTNTGPATSGYTEALDAMLGSAAGGLSAAGSLSGLSQGATDGTSLTLGLNTGTAGAISGSATLTLASDGAGIDGLGTTALAPIGVTGSGGVFAYAAAQIAAGTLSLGIHHVGDSVSRDLAVTNSGPSTGGYTEALDAALGGASAGFTATGSISGLGAQGTDTSSLLLGLGSATAGVFTGTATLTAQSDGGGIDGLGTTALANQTVNVSGTIDNYATLTIEEIVGKKITHIANGGTINLGSVAMGAKGPVIKLGMLNAATGVADVLGGSFATAGKGFTLKNFTPFSNLAAGHDEEMQSVTLKTTAAGVFSETITVNAVGSNASGYSGGLAPETITITGTVTTGHAPAFMAAATAEAAASVSAGVDTGWAAFSAPAAAAAASSPAVGGIPLGWAPAGYAPDLLHLLLHDTLIR